MKALRLSLLILTCVFSLYAIAQNPDPSQDTGQSAQGPGPGQRGGRGAWSGGMGTGHGVIGVVIEAASDHFTIKTDTGETYTVHYSVNTRIMKGGGGQRRNAGETEIPMTPPQAIKATEIKIGDVIGASGEVDASAKSVGAIFIFQIDPERARQMREMQANYGKTWLMGKVTAINDLKVTLQGGPDNSAHTFVADENTTFRKRRDPITLADVQVGDMVRVEGAVKNGAFVASAVAVMGQPSQRPGRESGAPPVSPQ